MGNSPRIIVCIQKTYAEILGWIEVGSQDANVG